MNNYNSHTIYTFACKYKEADLTIIPIKSRSKEPVIKWSVYQQEKPDQNQIDLWFKDRSTDQIGIGIILADDLIGIDFDKPELMPFILGDTKDPRGFTWVAQTSKGIHVYFRAKDIKNNLEIPGVVEIKTKNKYLIAPPSIHPSGSEYKWLTDINKVSIFALNVEQEKVLCDRMFFLKKNWKLIEILNKAWKQGQRNQLSLFTAGILRKAGWKKEQTSDLLWILCLLNADKEEDNRLNTVESTYDQDIKNIAGISKLEELLNEEDINAVKKLLKIEKKKKQRNIDKEIIDKLEEEGRFFINHEHDFFFKNTETFFIDSIYFDKIIGDYYEQITGKLINKERLNKIKDTAKRRALNGSEFKTFNRIGIKNGNIYYYLGRQNNKSKIIEINKNEWKILENEPDLIFFKRYKHTSNQVIPISSNDFDVDGFLKRIFNLKEEKDFLLFKTWLISCFIPEISHPLLNLYGSEGSGKTKFLEFIRQLVDPSPILTSALPINQRDRNLNLFHNYICCFDNLSRLNTKDSPDIADHLSRSITGQGLSERLLFTNDEEKIYVDKTIICINGINQLIRNPDLADRSLTFELERIKAFIPDSVLEADFKNNLPYLLGYIFNILNRVLNEKEPPSHLLKFIRLSDFGYYGYKIANAIGWKGEEFINEFRNQGAFLKTGLANEDDLITAIVEFIKYEQHWCGKSKDLLMILDEKQDETPHLKLPNNGASLTRKLNKFKQTLFELGIEYNYISWKRQICLKKINQNASKKEIKNNNNTYNPEMHASENQYKNDNCTRQTRDMQMHASKNQYKNDNCTRDMQMHASKNQYKNDNCTRQTRDMHDISTKRKILDREQLTGIVHDQKNQQEVRKNSVVTRAAVDSISRALDISRASNNLSARDIQNIKIPFIKRGDDKTKYSAYKIELIDILKDTKYTELLIETALEQGLLKKEGDSIRLMIQDNLSKQENKEKRENKAKKSAINNESKIITNGYKIDENSFRTPFEIKKASLLSKEDYILHLKETFKMDQESARAFMINNIRAGKIEEVNEDQLKLKEIEGNKDNVEEKIVNKLENKMLLPFKITKRDLLKKQVYIQELKDSGLSSNEAEQLLIEGIEQEIFEDQGDGYIFAYVNGMNDYNRENSHEPPADPDKLHQNNDNKTFDESRIINNDSIKRGIIPPHMQNNEKGIDVVQRIKRKIKNDMQNNKK